MSGITLFKAKKIITMDRNRPGATHVAVRDGPILAVGGPDCAEGRGRARIGDPLTAPPEALKDIAVVGAVLGGQPTGDA